MFRQLWLSVALAFALVVAGSPAAEAEPSPSAYVTGVDLRGADSTEGTAIRREGALLRPKLLMGLYAGDEVFLREAASRITIETADGTEQEISGAGASFTVTGEAATGDGLWGFLDVVAEAIGGGSDESVPDNMMTRDDGQGLRIPMAVKGANYIMKSGDPIWIAWAGGTAPFRMTITAGDSVTYKEGISTREASLDLPPAATSRIRVKVEDAGGRTDTVLLRLEEDRPARPPGMTATAGGVMRDIAYAAWLTGLDDGSWSVEAARLLRTRAGDSAAAESLLARIAAGWKSAGTADPSN